MAIDAAVDVCAIYASVILAGASVAPPLSRSKETDNRGTGGNCDVRWPGVSSNIDLGAFSKGIKPLQRKTNGSRFAGSARVQNSFCHFDFARTVSD